MHQNLKEMFFLNSIAAIAGLSSVVISVKGFHRRTIPRAPARSSAIRVEKSDGRNDVFFGSPPIKPLGNQFGFLGDEKESEDWSMEEDWALIDNLPLFTVSSLTETRTMWSQLWSANAILFSKRRPEDLYRRALELDDQRAFQKTKLENDEKEYDQRTPSLSFGASPPVLENWKTDLQTNDNRVVGQVILKENEGRRTIWFHYHVIGRLEGDPFADKSSNAVPVLPGGYIEAVGGRIYELGQPISLDDCRIETTNTLSDKQRKIDIGPVRGDDESSKIPSWWLSTSTAVIAALLSSTILSACIGYGAGLSIIQDTSYHHQSTSPAPRMLTVETVLAGPSQSSSLEADKKGTKPLTLSKDYYPDQEKPSIEEQRSRVQFKVLREERLLKKITQRLELDKQTLNQLEEQQSSQLLP